MFQTNFKPSMNTPTNFQRRFEPKLKFATLLGAYRLRLILDSFAIRVMYVNVEGGFLATHPTGQMYCPLWNLDTVSSKIQLIHNSKHNGSKISFFQHYKDPQSVGKTSLQNFGTKIKSLSSWGGYKCSVVLSWLFLPLKKTVIIASSKPGQLWYCAIMRIE